MNHDLLTFSLVIAALVAVATSYFLIKANKKLRYYRSRYRNIINVDEAISKKTTYFRSEEARVNKLLTDMQSSLANLKVKYQKASDAYDVLSYENNLLKDNLEIADFGLYEAHFDFDTSEKFKAKIQEIREEQKSLIRTQSAVIGGEGWTVNNSIQKGKTMVKRQKKLMLRAFNGESDSFISSVRWNNEKRMEERMERSLNAINKMGETQGLTISRSYYLLKLKELWLTYEYQLKRYEEKEEQREIKARMREEEKAARDFERAQREAEKEEKMLQRAMKKVREEVQRANEAERMIYEKQLAQLEAQLRAAEEKNQRAISMAQMTKSGHVYVISNVGSFGENVYKIGMTRRLEPMDRVNELGDASVPFKFDVHAMIYSDNAPELESQLHRAFEKHRMNYVNRRREYFQVSLEDIKEVVHANHGEIEFIIEPEAKEFRESQAIRLSTHEKSTPRKEEPKFSSVANLFD